MVPPISENLHGYIYIYIIYDIIHYIYIHIIYIDIYYSCIFKFAVVRSSELGAFRNPFSPSPRENTEQMEK